MLKVVINIAVFGAFVLIVAVLGFFLWQTLFAAKEYSNGQEKSEPAYSEQQTGTENTVRGSPSPSQGEATDKAIAEYTKWLAIFTLFLVLATIGLFISGERNIEVARQTAAKQLRIMQGQLASMMAGQRPWVYAHVALYEPSDPAGRSLWFEDDGLHITIEFILHNTGSLPANSVRIEMRPHNMMTIPIVAQRELCDPLRTAPVNALGSIGPSLFPGQAYAERQSWVLPIAEIQKDNAYKLFSEAPNKTAGQVPMISPLIVGCVDYQIPGGDGHHQTRFAFRLGGNIELPGGHLYTGGVPLTKEPLPVKNFGLSRDIDGRLYAAD
jgi:hypothetical protein